MSRFARHIGTQIAAKISPTTQEDCRWVVCSYGHLLPKEDPERRFTGAEFAQMIRDNYDMDFMRNLLAAQYAEDGIGEVWNRHLGDAIGDGFNWTLNPWVEGLSFSALEGVAGRKFPKETDNMDNTEGGAR